MLGHLGGGLDPDADMRRHFESAEARGVLDRMLYADAKTYLHELLMKQDQMSMAASIESRVPFLDHNFVGYTARMPRRMKLRRELNTNYILRRAMEGVLPEQILRRGKMGFPVPIGRWFRGEFRYLLGEHVTGGRAAAHEVSVEDAGRGLLALHLAGEGHSERLWPLVNFERWRRLLDGEAAAEPHQDLAETVAAAR